jgi:hypothetical protein
MSATVTVITGPVLALRAGLRNFWLADPVLPGLLGGEKIYDTAPRSVVPPYVTFGNVSARQWLASSLRGHEQEVSVSVWSRQMSDRESLEIASRLSLISDGAVPAIAGYQLWPLQVVMLDCPQGNLPDNPQGLRQVVVTLRAFSAPLSSSQ